MTDYKVAHSEQQIQHFLDTNGGIALIDFHATWCGPCRIIDPYIKESAKKNGILLIKVNVDQAPGLSSDFGVSAMPTFFVVQGTARNKVHTGIGGSKKTVDQAIRLLKSKQLTE